MFANERTAKCHLSGSIDSGQVAEHRHLPVLWFDVPPDTLLYPFQPRSSGVSIVKSVHLIASAKYDKFFIETHSGGVNLLIFMILWECMCLCVCANALNLIIVCVLTGTVEHCSRCTFSSTPRRRMEGKYHFRIDLNNLKFNDRRILLYHAHRLRSDNVGANRNSHGYRCVVKSNGTAGRLSYTSLW